MVGPLTAIGATVILHRMGFSDAQIQFLLCWRSNAFDTCLRNAADKVQPLIDRHIQDHANYPPCLDLLVSRQKIKQEVQAAPSGAGRQKQSLRPHGNFLVLFKMEDHPGFCLPNHHLHGLKCGHPECERTFVPNLKEERRLGKAKASWPAANKPVCCCENIRKGVGACRQHKYFF
jgi:hypothetical protein